MSNIAQARQAVIVTLGGQDFPVKPFPFPKIRKAKNDLVNVLADLIKPQSEGRDEMQTLDFIFESFMEIPHKVFSIFIKNLPEEVFTDEDNGATIPEIIDAFRTCLEINHLNDIKSFFSTPMGRTLAGLMKRG